MKWTDEATFEKGRTERMKGKYQTPSYLCDPEAQQRDMCP